MSSHNLKPEPGRVYLLPADLPVLDKRRDIDLGQLAFEVWQKKWRIAAATFCCGIISIAYAFMATEWYRAEVTLAPADERSGQGLSGQLGGLASLAGITVDGGSTAEPIAILKSREFARLFIEEYELLPVLLFEDWNPATRSWRSADPANWPDIRDALKVFDEEVRAVSEDTKTGMVTLSVNWTEPDLAAQWANLLVRRLNSSMRARALAEAESNIRYLQGELAATSVLTLQQSIGRLLESEMQKLMLARGNDEYAFRIIDPAMIPKERLKPRRTLIVGLSTILGLIASTMVVILLVIFRSAPDDAAHL